MEEQERNKRKQTRIVFFDDHNEERIIFVDKYRAEHGFLIFETDTNKYIVPSHRVTIGKEKMRCHK